MKEDTIDPKLWVPINRDRPIFGPQIPVRFPRPPSHLLRFVLKLFYYNFAQISPLKRSITKLQVRTIKIDSDSSSTIV